VEENDPNDLGMILFDFVCLNMDLATEHVDFDDLKLVYYANIMNRKRQISNRARKNNVEN
jgi:hypothetical protein